MFNDDPPNNYDDDDLAPAPHRAAAAEIDQLLTTWKELLNFGDEKSLKDYLQMIQPSAPAPTSPLDQVHAHILGNMDALRQTFPGVVAQPEAFLANVASVVLMAAFEIVWRANDTGQLEQAVAFGQWFREII